MSPISKNIYSPVQYEFTQLHLLKLCANLIIFVRDIEKKTKVGVFYGYTLYWLKDDRRYKLLKYDWPK